MGTISSFPSRYLYGIGKLPLHFAATAGTTILGQALGLNSINLIQRLFRGFQSESRPVVDQYLPTSSQSLRLAAHVAVVLYSNQLWPIIEEVLCRWLLQDKILTIFTSSLPNIERKVPVVEIKRNKTRKYTQGAPLFSERAKTIGRIFLTSLLFGWLHYRQEFHRQSSEWLSHKQIIENASYAFFNSFGSSLFYGHLYEEKGLAASFGAHAAWNMAIDLWIFNHWKLKN